MKPLVSTFLFALALFTLTFGSGCDTADDGSDAPRALAGVWQGPITHPNPDFSGTLTLNIVEQGNTITGSATWRYPTDVITGTLSGGAPDEGPIAYTLDFADRGVYFHDVDGGNSALSGTWESSRGITGTVALERP